MFVSVADIFNPKNRIQYVHYWNKEYDDLSDAVKKLKPHQTTNLAVDLKLLLYIGTEIDDFTAGQAGVYTPKFDDLKENNFQDIIKTISPPEETSLQQLTKLMAAQYLAELNKKLHDGEYVPLELESGTIPEKKEQDEKEDSRQHMHG